MKYYYLVNGEVKAEIDGMESVNLIFEAITLKLKQDNHFSWLRTSPNIKQIMGNGILHVFCTDEYLKEFKK